MKKGKKRWDGDEILLSPYQKMEAHFISDRVEATVYHRLILDLSKTHPALKDYNLSLFTYTIMCMVKTMKKYPEMNRFVMNHRLYARNHMAISTVIKQRLTTEGKSIVVKEEINPDTTIFELNEQMKTVIFALKQSDESANADKLIEFFGKLPHWIIQWILAVATFLNHTNLLPKSIAQDDPLHASVMFANLGSIDLAAPFHHLYRWGTISVFVVLGKVNKTNQTVECTFSVDERIADGYLLSRALLYFQHLMEQPDKIISIDSPLE
ncbi:MAG TPA: hypothetical protein DEA51_02870 [Erysipelotrichaceae bacterium]|nr:hypothetical protein [Erysipelotrichaceae bacterium]